MSAFSCLTRSLTGLALVLLVGCEPSGRAQFPVGSQLYNRTDHHLFGKVVGFEATHDFHNGTPPEQAILIEQESDHTTVWGACTTCSATFDVKTP